MFVIFMTIHILTFLYFVIPKSVAICAKYERTCASSLDHTGLVWLHYNLFCFFVLIELFGLIDSYSFNEHFVSCFCIITDNHYIDSCLNHSLGFRNGYFLTCSAVLLTTVISIFCQIRPSCFLALSAFLSFFVLFVIFMNKTEMMNIENAFSWVSIMYPNAVLFILFAQDFSENA